MAPYWGPVRLYWENFGLWEILCAPGMGPWLLEMALNYGPCFEASFTGLYFPGPPSRELQNWQVL